MTQQEMWQREALSHLRQVFLWAEEREDGEDWGLAVTGLAMVIWQMVYRNHISHFCRDPIRRRLAGQMEGALSYIHRHYEEEMELADLARLAHLSESQFCRSFKRLTGWAPFSYLNRWRIMQSCLLLLQTDKKISEIGMLCGFNTVSYFNREFLKIVKVTPSAYRRDFVYFGWEK